jgi:hypothetical protein
MLHRNLPDDDRIGVNVGLGGHAPFSPSERGPLISAANRLGCRRGHQCRARKVVMAPGGRGTGQAAVCYGKSSA